MPTKTSLQGGGFQDSEGNVLANGYLVFKLSQDATVPGVGNVASGIDITIQLDGNGNVLNATSPGQQIWGNDVLLPVNTFYRVTGYTSAGQPAWGPNNQQVMGSPFNLGSWIPNQIISWVPSVQSILIEANGTPTLNQSVLNLESTDNSITITDIGNGSVNLRTAGGASGTGYSLVNCQFNIFDYGANDMSIANTAWQLLPGIDFLQGANSWTITVKNSATTYTDQWAIARTLPNSVTVLDWTAIKFGGIANPTFAPGLHTSDTVNLVIDSAHDYWLAVAGSNLAGYHLDTRGQTQLLYGGSAGPGVANLIGGSSITDYLGGQPPVNSTIYQWLFAMSKVS